MGCTEANTLDLDNHHLSLTLKKTSIALTIYQNRLKMEGVQLEKQLIRLIEQAKKQRYLKIQQQLIQRITFIKNKIQIYSIVISNCNRILDYKNYLQDKDKIHIILPTLRNILFCVSILQDQRLNQFKSLLQSKYPDIKQSQMEQVEDQIQRYHKNTTQVTRKMMTQYIFLLCNQEEKITLEKINLIGHNFHYQI